MALKSTAIAAAVLLLVGAAFLLLLPHLVERAVLKKLAEVGLSPASLEVRDLSFDRVRFTQVRIEESFAVDEVDVELDLWPLSSPRVTEVRLSGARWSIGTGTSGLDLSPFDRLQTGARARSELPFERVELRSAEITVGPDITIRVEASLEKGSGRPVLFALIEPMIERPIRVAGASITLQAELDLAARRISRLELDSFAQEAVFGEYAMEELVLAAKPIDDSIEWNLTSWGLDYQAGRITGWIPASLDAWKARPSLALVFDLAAERFGLELGLEGMGRVEIDPPRLDLDQVRLTAKGDLITEQIRMERLSARAELFGAVDRYGGFASLERGSASIESAGLTRSRARMTGLSARLPKQRNLAEIRFSDGEPRARIEQRIRWKQLYLGDLELGSGYADVELEAPRSIRLDHAETHPKEGGTLWIDTLELELGEKRVAFVLLIDHVPYRRWLALVAKDKVTGDGRVSGHVPVQLTLSDPPRLALGRGDLTGKPGAKLRVEDLSVARALIEGASVSGSDLAELVKQRLLEALQDLELWRLDIDFVPTRDDVDLIVNLAGQGTRGARQEIGGLTVHVHNFGTALNEILRFGAEAAELRDRAKEEMENDSILELFQ